MNQRLSEIVRDMYDRLYSWMMFTAFVTIVLCLMINEVINGRRK